MLYIYMLVKHADTFQVEFASILVQIKVRLYLNIYKALNPANTLVLTAVFKL